jgi:Flp pilus assembly protein TadG
LCDNDSRLLKSRPPPVDDAQVNTLFLPRRSATFLARPRRGFTLVYILIMFTVLCGFVSLAVDWSRVQMVKTKLQATVDAAARAACFDLPNGTTAAKNAAISIASQNNTDGSAVTLNPATDIIFGTWDPNARTFTPLSGAAASNANAVRVQTSRSAARGNAVSLSFAQVLGRSTCDVNVISTTCLTGSPGDYSIIGINSMTLGLTAYTDSYNAQSGAYVQASAHHRGSVASNGNIVATGTVKIDGDARCGIGKSTSLGGSCSVTGLNAPLGITLAYPSVVLPATYTDLGDVNMSSGSTSVPGGTYLIHNLNLSGTAHVTWSGPTVLYIQNSYSVSGSALVDTYQNLPANRTLNFLPTCTTATWTGSNTNVGEMYAPDTDFTISGSVHMFGRVVAKSINNTSSGGMHYDESLAAPGATASSASIQVVK